MAGQQTGDDLLSQNQQRKTKEKVTEVIRICLTELSYQNRVVCPLWRQYLVLHVAVRSRYELADGRRVVNFSFLRLCTISDSFRKLTGVHHHASIFFLRSLPIQQPPSRQMP